jgi:hypothetical protein
MRKRFFLFLLLLLISAAAFADKKKTESAPILPDVTDRGRLLYEYDQAAWHATDAVQPLNPPREFLGMYIARKSGSGGWTVVFGHLNENRHQFLVGCEATEGPTLNQFIPKKLETPRSDTAFYLFAARAIDTALHDFRGEKRRYNVAVLPASSDQLYVYVMPAQTQNDVYPLGGDVRYLVSPDGNTIVDRHQMHKTIIENRGDVPKGATPAGGYHTHILSDVPEDTDVFYVLTRKPSEPEFVVGRNRKSYEIDTEGNIREVKK